MKQFKSLALAGVVALSGAFTAVNADALSFTVLNSSAQNGAANNADVFGASYGAFDLGGTFSPTTPGINIEVGSANGLNKSPWVDTPLAGVNSYFSVQPNGAGASSPVVTLTFAAAQSAFNILWGSIDSYNTIKFLGGTTGSQLFTGTQIAAASSGCGNPNNFECVAEVSFSGGTFTSIEFSSGGSNSFEFATIPLPAAAWLLLGAAGALVAAKRRSSLRAAA